jgi:hypothetical protein
MVRLGRVTPVIGRMKKGWARSWPQSVRLTVVARTLTRISPGPGLGFGISRTSMTSGDP